MAGKSQTSEKLNCTLLKIATEFHKHGIKGWFISYGTLLGIIRENSCIDGDDDIDICMDVKNFAKCKPIMKRVFGWKGWPEKRRPTTYKIIQTSTSEKYCRIDLYKCRVNAQGDFHDIWEDVTWSGVYLNTKNKTIPHIMWRGVKLYIPNNHIQKLESRYGSTWRKRIERGTDAGDGYRNIKTL